MPRKGTLIGMYLGEQPGTFFFRPVGGGTMDDNLRRGGSGIFQPTFGTHFPQFHGGHILRIVFVTETVAYVLHVEVHVHQSVFTVYHIAVFQLVALKDETLLAILHTVFAEQLEEFLNLEVVQRFGIRTAECGVHLHTGHACFRSGMQHLVPFPTTCQVLLLHFFQGGKLGDVLHDQVHIDMAVLLGCGDILPGVVIEFVHHLHLETPESALDGFRLAIVRHRGLVQVADSLKEVLRFRFLVSTLIVCHYLVRFHLPRLQSHAVGVILRKEVFHAEGISQEDFRAGIHHLVYVDSACHHALLLLIIILVVKIQLRAVTIPQRVRHIRKLGVEQRHEFVLESDLAMNGAIPPQLDGSFIQVINNRLRGLYRFQPVFLTDGTGVTPSHDTVKFLEYLHVVIHGKLTALQAQQDASFTGADLTGGLVTGSTADKCHVATLLVVVVLFQQAGFALWKRMLKGLAKLLAQGDNRVAHQLLVRIAMFTMLVPQSGFLRHHGVQHLGVQYVLCLAVQ